MKLTYRLISEFAKTALDRLIPGRGFGPIDSCASLEAFTTSRAAYIAQKTMYGYVKTRMGTSYPEMFRNDEIAHSVRIATLEHFAICLSDLTIFTTTHALYGSDLDTLRRKEIAENIYKAGIEGRIETVVPEFDPEAAIAAFRQHIADVDWQKPAGIEETFSRCLDSIMRWAPIADELKSFDHEYVRNSVRFSWINVRKLFFKRLDRDSLAADLPAIH